MINPITSFSAGGFLLFYAIVCAATLVACRWYVRSHDPTQSLLPPAVTPKVDAYEIAYLQGGENGLTRVIIIGLAERGYLQATEKGIERTATRPAALVGVEQTVHDWFSTRRTAEEVFGGDLPHRVGAHCLGYEERLQQERLVRDEASKAFDWNAAVLGGLVMVGIGGWRLLVSRDNQEPVGFLIFMSFASLSILNGVCSPDRLTARGKAYVERLKSILASLGSSTGSPYALAAAVLGIAALAGTPFEDLGTLFKKSRSSSSGGCGAGCDGGCGGCGGCGG